MEILRNVFWFFVLLAECVLNCLMIMAGAILQLAGFDEMANKILNKF